MPTELLRISPSGLTAEQVGTRAAATSYSGQAADESLRGAAARVDAAWASFLPRLTATARYAHLSNFTPPSFTLPGSTMQIPGTALSPVITEQYLLQANIVVPISDYLLRINQNYTSVTNSRDAARYDAVTARARSAADGKVAYYTWLRARSAMVVAVQALNDQKNHLNDAKNQFSVGNASRADVLRAETAQASAELQVERSKNLADLTEMQVRIAMHAKDDEALVPGEGLDTPPAAFAGNLNQLTSEAHSARFEVKSIDANADAAREQAKVARAGKYPVVSGFADAIYANPNIRFFPTTAKFFPTWDLGVQAIWSPNDFLVAGPGAADAESRAATLEAQKAVVRDSIAIEILQAFQAVKEADFAISSTARELVSATEAYRVARELFNNGRATATTLTDSETDLTRARLDALNASVDARTARVRLEHALGRDTHLIK